MVKLMGHVAMGLLFALPAWFRWDGRLPVAFAGFVLTTVMLPDVDLVLEVLFPAVEHHGVTHTVVFVAGVALVVGSLAGVLLAPRVEQVWQTSDGVRVTRRTLTEFVTGGLLLGGLSHVFADMLSAPDIADPIEPLWPFVNQPISFDVIYYSSIWWNLGLLVLAVVLHLALAGRRGIRLATTA
ncbi:metal-dependent hydrolase [Halosimplex salinum]|uniref:metal-dependent hydrolase n=1 Tax=Halosimplex salinum TaxID=1710538 RepID=UPI000F482BC0|nr:metal-dependent hydrolase [Halosimplex salinum]